MESRFVVAWKVFENVISTNIKSRKKSFRERDNPRSVYAVDILRECPVIPPIFLSTIFLQL